MLLTSFLALSFSVQVGPNAAGPDALGAPEELLERPPRPDSEKSALNPKSAWLADCLDLINEDPARAHSQAQIQRNDTSGTERVLANHCLGLAATELQLWDDAIHAFIAARDETPEDEVRARARFGAMAGNAALAGGNTARALAILRIAKDNAQAAASAPLQAITATDLARAMVAESLPEEALAELDLATSLQPEEPGVWLLKATLLRRLDRLGRAQAAIERAGELAPTDAEVGLEAGVIAVLTGREESARQSWQSVVDIAPDTPAAEVARSYLVQLAPKTEGTP